MTEELKFTDKERAAIRLVIAALNVEGTGVWDKSYAIQRIEDAVNVVRRGDPVGTVRYVDEGSPYIAIRIQPGNDMPDRYRWQTANLYPKDSVDRTPTLLNDDEVADWKIIYTPPTEGKS